VSTRIGWAIVTALGWIVGTLVATFVMGTVGRAISGVAAGLVYLAVYGALIGLCVAVAQIAAKRTLPRSWIARSVLGFAVGYVIVAFVGELLGNVIDPSLPLLVGEGTIEDLSGAALGIAIGLAQLPAIAGLTDRRRGWVIATAIGAGLGYGSAAGLIEFVGGPVLKASVPATFALILGLFVGVAQALVLRGSPLRSQS